MSCTAKATCLNGTGGAAVAHCSCWPTHRCDVCGDDQRTEDQRQRDYAAQEAYSMSVICGVIDGI